MEKSDQATNVYIFRLINVLHVAFNRSNRVTDFDQIKLI